VSWPVWTNIIRTYGICSKGNRAHSKRPFARGAGATRKARKRAFQTMPVSAGQAPISGQCAGRASPSGSFVAASPWASWSCASDRPVASLRSAPSRRAPMRLAHSRPAPLRLARGPARCARLRSGASVPGRRRSSSPSPSSSHPDFPLKSARAAPSPDATPQEAATAPTSATHGLMDQCGDADSKAMFTMVNPAVVAALSLQSSQGVQAL
jgi:hypothetical protein